MDAIIYALLSFGLVVVVMSVGGAILLFLWWSPVEQERIQPPKSEARGGTILRWEERARAGWQRHLEQLGRIFAPRDHVKLLRVRNRLAWAGYHDPRALRYFVGVKVACLILFGCAYFLYGVVVQRVLSHALPISLFFGGAGLLPPGFLASYAHSGSPARGPSYPT